MAYNLPLNKMEIYLSILEIIHDTFSTIKVKMSVFY